MFKLFVVDIAINNRLESARLQCLGLAKNRCVRRPAWRGVLFCSCCVLCLSFAFPFSVFAAICLAVCCLLQLYPQDIEPIMVLGQFTSPKITQPQVGVWVADFGMLTCFVFGLFLIVVLLFRPEFGWCVFINHQELRARPGCAAQTRRNPRSQVCACVCACVCCLFCCVLCSSAWCSGSGMIYVANLRAARATDRYSCLLVRF